MPAPRKPQDHKPKKTDGGLFSFVHGGRTYTFPRPFGEVVSPKFLRANRRRDTLDMTFTMIELLADDDQEILAVVDSMTLAEFSDLDEKLGRALRHSVDGTADAAGESSAS